MSLFLPAVSQPTPNVARHNLLDKEARRLGRGLLRTGEEEDDDDDDEDYDDDLMDLEASNIIFTPLLRYGPSCLLVDHLTCLTINTLRVCVCM